MNEDLMNSPQEGAGTIGDIILAARQLEAALRKLSGPTEVAGLHALTELLGSRLLRSGYAGHYAVRAIEETLGACTTQQGLHRVGLDAEGIEAFVRAHTEDV
jgi:hypothetical protein